MQIKTFPTIVIDFPERQILSRLGYSRHRSVLETEQRQWLGIAMHSGFGKCRCVGRYKLVEILANDGIKLLLSDDKELISRDFAQKCHGATHLALMAATAGQLIVSERDTALDKATGAVYDAVGSEVADIAIGWVHSKVQQELLRMGLVVDSRRFSAGYGDMELKNQQYFFEELKMAEMGIEISAKYIMHPEKTVTAAAPVREIGQE